MESLTTELKEKIVDVLNLNDIDPASIGDDDLLFGDKIGLDSIDALELIVLLEKDYGIKVATKEEGKEIFHSVKSLAEFIKSKQAA